MIKLRLNGEELSVESFEADAPDPRKGTVQAHLYGWSDDSICPTVTYGRCCPP